MWRGEGVGGGGKGKREIQGTYNAAARAHKANAQLVFHVSRKPPLQKLFLIIGEERLRDEPKEHLRGRLVSVWHESFVEVSFCKLAIIFQSVTEYCKTIDTLVEWIFVEFLNELKGKHMYHANLLSFQNPKMFVCQHKQRNKLSSLL